jgi:peptide/nickel transport system ATP-binding protein
MTATAAGTAAHSTSESAGLSIRGVCLRIPLPGVPRRWVHAAEDLSLDVAPGRITAVVGESGCGKSVLALAVLGLLPPGTRTTGEIRFAETDLLASDEVTLQTLRGTGVALIPQSAATHLTPVRTVGSVVIETLRRHNLPATTSAVDTLLGDVGLPPGTRTRYPHELSGGMAQRVLVAMTVALRPAVLVADEPTSALDPDTTTLVLDSLRARATAGGAVILITHDLESARAVADDVAVMYAGRLLEVGPTSIVLRDPAHDYTRALLAALPENGLHPPPGTPSSLVDPPREICAWHQRAATNCPATPLQQLAPGHLVACLEHP